MFWSMDYMGAKEVAAKWGIDWENSETDTL
jgi:hypothetical protein